MRQVKDWQLFVGVVVIGLAIAAVVFVAINGMPWSDKSATSVPTPADIEIPTDLTPAPTSPTPDSDVRLGQTIKRELGAFTVSDLRRNAQPAEAAEGEFVGVRIRSCNDAIDEADVSEAAFAGQNFVMHDSDGGEYTSSGSIYGQFPKPDYPFDRAVTKGSCITGFLVYDIPRGTKLTDVAYILDGQQQFSWSLR